jgi:hypothetical protein
VSSQNPDDLLRQLPPDLVAQLSQQLGVDEATAQQGLADVLPGLMGAAGQPGGLQAGEEPSSNTFAGGDAGQNVMGSLETDGAGALQVGGAPPAAPDPGNYGGTPGGLEQGGADPTGGLGDILGQVLGGQGGQGGMPGGMEQGGDPMGGLGDILGGLLGGAQGGGMPGGMASGGEDPMGGLGAILGQVLGGQGGAMSGGAEQGGDPMGGLGAILGQVLGGGQEPGAGQSGQGGGVNWGPIIAALAPLVIGAIANRQRQGGGPMGLQAESGPASGADAGEEAGGDQILGSLSDDR